MHPKTFTTSSLEIKNDKIILEILKSKQQILESKNVNKHPGCLFEQGRSFPPILTEGAPIRTGALIRSFTVACTDIVMYLQLYFIPNLNFKPLIAVIEANLKTVYYFENTSESTWAQN